MSRRLTFKPLTASRWADLVKLFGPRGACGGCWCMWWKRPRAEWARGKGGGNRRAFAAVVRSGTAPGILAYDGTEPVGWIAVEPREAYPMLARSRTLKPVDAKLVWSVTCFFIAKDYRGRGLTTKLLDAAAKHAASRGGRILEGYPIDTGGRTLPGAWIWTGHVESFRAARFREVARPSKTRPIMRRTLRPART